MCWVQNATKAVFQCKTTALYEGSMKLLSFKRERKDYP